jgi:hypothetical protein
MPFVQYAPQQPQRPQPVPPPYPQAPPPGQAQAQPLARLPLQIGTTATWGAARAAASLFPSLGCIVGGVILLVNASSDDNGSGFVGILIGGLLLVYACIHLYGALKTRASDLLFYPEGLHVDGGRLHGRRFGWQELAPPFARIEDTTANRLTVWRIFLFVLSLSGRGYRRIVSPVTPVRVWRLWLNHRGQELLVAETDRPIEADSMTAAATSIDAVLSGRKSVEEAPSVAVQVTVCAACGAPAVPDDAPAVACAYCRQWVQLPAQVRSQAAAAKALEQSRGTTAKMVAKLREQPRAARVNGWLFVYTLMMFGAWPLGWGLIAYRVLDDGFQPLDALFLALPFAAVLGGFFFARGRLADRGALQLLTLGFGALAPRREGEPSRCRRCQGPLPGAGLGGVAQCRYCNAENIVGLDLRPSIDPARAEQQTFDLALKKRAKEKVLWGMLTVVATLALLGWAAGTAAYILD